MPRDVTSSEQHPHDRLTRLCDAMSVALEQHPENRADSVKAIVLLDDFEEHRGGLVTHGYEDDRDALLRLIEHARAIARGRGIPLEISVDGQRLP